MFNPLKIEAVMNETRSNVHIFLNHGYSLKEVRKEMINCLQAVHDFGEAEKYNEVSTSPVAGIKFAYTLNKVFGIYNEVLYKEFGIDPIHIKEIKSVTVDCVEVVLNMPIDEVFQLIASQEGGLH